MRKKDGPFAFTVQYVLKVDDDGGEGDAGHNKNEKNHALKHSKPPVKYYDNDDDKEEVEDEGVSKSQVCLGFGLKLEFTSPLSGPSARGILGQVEEAAKAKG